MLGELFRAYAHTRPRRANFFAPKLLALPLCETAGTNAGASGCHHETRDAFARRHSIKNGCFWRAMVPSVSLETEHAPAKVMTVSRESPAAPVGGGRAWLRCPWAAAWPGRASRRRAATHSTAGATGVEGAGGTCRGAGGRRRGLAGLRDDAPSEARSADGSRAGRRPRAHQAARPSRQPGTPKGRVPKYPPLTQPLPRRGSGRMTVSPGDGDASTGTCRPRRPLPGPLRR